MNLSIKRKTSIRTVVAGKTIYQFRIKPARRKPIKENPATVNAYGNWVETWFKWRHCAPADDMIVVSEMGEQ